MLEKVVFSERAIIALLSETHEHIKTETGGVFLGHRYGNIWYIVETIDPGLNCIFQPAYFEYDDVYLNHLMNKVDRLYKKPLEIIGLWHRHPGSFDRFSGTDDGTNIKYAKRHQDGAISALVNIDPNFRITMYHVTDPLSYRKVKYTVGDKYFPPEFLAYATRKEYLNRINHPNGLENGLFSKLKRVGGFINGKDTGELFSDKYLAKKFSFSNILHEYLYEEKTKEKCEVEYTDPNNLTDADLDIILERIQADLDYFEETGIKVTLTMLTSGGLELKDNCVMTGSTPIAIILFTHYDKVLFNYNEKSFEYFPGMLKDACEFYTLLGDDL